MRTTLTLDDDVVVRLERLRGARRGLKPLINEVLRIGLDRLERGPTADRPPFSTGTHRLGAKVPGLDNVAEVLAAGEAEDWR
jgi:hypothetical protein